MVRIAWRDLAGWAVAGRDAGRHQRLCGRGHRGGGGIRRARTSARTYGEPRSAGGRARSPSSCSAWASSAAASSISPPTSISSSSSPTRATTSRRALHRQRGLLHAPRPAGDPPAGRAHRRRQRVPRRHAAAALRRQRAADRERRVPRRLPADPRPRLGAIRVGQGARHHRRRLPTSSIHAESVRPFVYRRYLDFGVFESAARDEGADPEGSRAPRPGRPREARAGRNPRDRIHRAGLPADPRRPGPAHADTSRCWRCCRSWPAASCCPRASRRSSRPPIVFLRRLENRLQMLGDAQMHTIPAGRADARTHRASPWASPTGRPAAPSSSCTGRSVTRAFQEVMFARNEAAPAEMPGVNGIVEAWLRGRRGSAARRGTRGARLRRCGRRPPRCSPSSAAPAPLRRLDAPGRARLDTLHAAPAGGHRRRPDLERRRRRSTCCAGSCKVLEAIGSRSAYFALLNENAQVRRKLVELAGARRIPRRADRLASAAARRIAGRILRRAAVAARGARARNDTRGSRTWPTTNRSGRWRCCGNFSAPRFSAWPWPISRERFR